MNAYYFIMYKINYFSFKYGAILLKRKKQYQGFKTKEADYYCQSILFHCYLNLFLNIDKNVENILLI